MEQTITRTLGFLAYFYFYRKFLKMNRTSIKQFKMA